MSNDWRNNPATEKQKEKLCFFGCTWDEGITKGQAHDAIDSCVKMFPEKEKEYQNRPATEAQMEEIQFFLEGYGETFEDYAENGETLTYQRAAEMIKEWELEEAAAQEADEIDALEKEYLIDVEDWSEIYPGLTWERVQSAASALDQVNPGWRQESNHRDLMLAKVAEMNPQLTKDWEQNTFNASETKQIKTKRVKAKITKSESYTQHCLHCGIALELQISGIPPDKKFTEEDLTLLPITCPNCGCTTEVLGFPLQ